MPDDVHPSMPPGGLDADDVPDVELARRLVDVKRVDPPADRFRLPDELPRPRRAEGEMTR